MSVFDYLAHTYNCNSLSYLERYEKNELPEWFAWYNPYSQSINYEYLDFDAGVFVRKVIPKRFPDISEFAFVDLLGDNLFMILYHKKNQMFYIIAQFVAGGRDDIIIQDANLYNPRIFNQVYYFYGHTVTRLFHGSDEIDRKITYLFVSQDQLQVYYFYHDDPLVLNRISLENVKDAENNPWDIKNLDTRISKIANWSTGKHGIYYLPFNFKESIFIRTQLVAGPNPIYSEEKNSIALSFNFPTNVYYAGGRVFSNNTFIINDIPTLTDGITWHVCDLTTKGFSDTIVSTRAEERNFGWGSNQTTIVVFGEGVGNLAYILIA